MTKKTLLLIFIITLFNCKKAEIIEKVEKPKKEYLKVPPKIIIDYDNLIGFACYSSGNESDPVKKISEILKKKEFTIIKKKLLEKNIAEKYLATVSCEKLQQKNLIHLTNDELKQIKINKKSDEKVNTCSGCTNSETMTLNELFFSDSNYIREQTEEWLNEIIK